MLYSIDWSVRIKGEILFCLQLFGANLVGVYEN